MSLTLTTSKLMKLSAKSKPSNLFTQIIDSYFYAEKAAFHEISFTYFNSQHSRAQSNMTFEIDLNESEFHIHYSTYFIYLIGTSNYGFERDDSNWYN
jgi:hypothetical protein